MPSKEDDVWEKEAFDHATYAALFDYLTGRQGATPFYLHMLLFMLRFSELPTPVGSSNLTKARVLSGRSIASLGVAWSTSNPH